jgi:hypothetical protein
VPQIPGASDPAEVKRARLKYTAIQRAKRRLENRLADIDWEIDELTPGREALEQRITVVGELPTFEIADDEDTD